MKCFSALAFLWLFLPPPPAYGAPILISEVLYDAEGRDDGGTFVELYGPPGLGLGGYRLEAINGGGGGVTHLLDLGAFSIPADGFLVLADEASTGGTRVAEADVLVSNLDFQNGPDSVRVLFGESVVDALGYGDFGAGDVFAGEGTPAVAAGPGMSLARWYANLDTDDNRIDFAALTEPTPGTGDRLETVPEPASLLLLGAGAALLCARRFRGRRRSG
jgi:hypothetical protein